jgi:hypothetical protein
VACWDHCYEGYGRPNWELVIGSLVQHFAKDLNTYSLVNLIGLQAYSVPIEFDGTFDPSFYLLASALATYALPTFICHMYWLAVLLLATTAMLVSGAATAIMNMTRRGPDILESFSTVSRDNRYIDEESPGSTLDSDSRARNLRDIKVMLGDVAHEEEVGHIAIATTRNCMVARLHGQRLYD